LNKLRYRFRHAQHSPRNRSRWRRATISLRLATRRSQPRRNRATMASLKRR
jgi:hypothetical protein